MIDVEQIRVVEAPPTRYEYAETNSLGRANEMAEYGWRVVALALSANGAKVYVLEREKAT